MLGIQTGVFRILDLHGMVYGRSEKEGTHCAIRQLSKGFQWSKAHIPLEMGFALATQRE